MSLPVSVIITFHHEGVLAHPTLRSVATAVSKAETAGIGIETLLILDRPDERTEATVRSSAAAVLPQATIVVTDHGDQAGSRNDGIARASHELVALIDGDDLIGENWVVELSAKLTMWGPEVVAHPAVCLMFEDEPRNPPVAWLIQDSRDPSFNFSMLAQQNAWPACVALHRSTARRFPFIATPNSEGFAAEDLHWNLILLGAGIHHAVIPETSYCYRIRGHANNVRKGRPIRPVSVLRETQLLKSLGRFEPSGAMMPSPAAPPQRAWHSEAFRELAVIARGVERRVAPSLLSARQKRRDQAARPPIASKRWFLNHLDAASEIEPRLATGLAHDYQMHQVTNQPDAFSDLYWEFVDYLGTDIHHLVIASDPEHVLGDSDATVLLTTGSGSGVASRLGAKLEALCDPHFSADRLLSVVVTQLTPASVTICGSATAWKALLRWGLAMSQASEINVAFHELDISEGVRLLPLEAQRIREVSNHLTRIEVATAAQAHHVVDVFGIPAELVTVNGQSHA